MNAVQRLSKLAFWHAGFGVLRQRSWHSGHRLTGGEVPSSKSSPDFVVTAPSLTGRTWVAKDDASEMPPLECPSTGELCHSGWCGVVNGDVFCARWEFQ